MTLHYRRRTFQKHAPEDNCVSRARRELTFVKVITSYDNLFRVSGYFGYALEVCMSMVAVVDSEIRLEGSAHPGLLSHRYCPCPFSLSPKLAETIII